MKTLLLFFFLCSLAFAAYADEQATSTGERLKSDAKGFAGSVAKATKDVGKQIGAGTRKAVTSTKKKVNTDAKQGVPGDGSAKRRNEKTDTAKAGRK